MSHNPFQDFARQVARNIKKADIMIPGANQSRGSLVDSFPAAQYPMRDDLTAAGQNADFYSRYAPEPTTLTNSEIGRNDAGLPFDIAEELRVQNTMKDAPKASNPWTTVAPDPVFGAPATDTAAATASPTFAERMQALRGSFRGALPRGVARAGQLMDRYIGTNTGLDPANIDEIAIQDSRNRSYKSMPAQVGRETGRVIDDITNPGDGGFARAGKGLVDRNIKPLIEGATEKTPVPAAIQAPPTDNTAKFPLDPNLAYGLGGAGAGALLGATMSPKGKRGRNALLGAGLGGAAGLLANALQSRNAPAVAQGVKTGWVVAALRDTKRQQHQKQAESTMDSLKNFGAQGWQSIKDTYNKLPTDVIEGAGTGGLIGATAAGIGGAMAPGYVDVTDDEGNVIGKKPRSRFSGAMRGSLYGKLLGLGVGGAVGHMAPEQTHNLHAFIQQQGKSLYDNMINRPMSQLQQAAKPATPV